MQGCPHPSLGLSTVLVVVIFLPTIGKGAALPLEPPLSKQPHYSARHRSGLPRRASLLRNLWGTVALRLLAHDRLTALRLRCPSTFTLRCLACQSWTFSWQAARYQCEHCAALQAVPCSPSLWQSQSSKTSPPLLSLTRSSRQLCIEPYVLIIEHVIRVWSLPSPIC